MINRSAFIDLLSRYETDRCTPEERQLVEQWYELLGEPVAIPLTQEEWEMMEHKLWNRVRPLSEGEEPTPVRSLWNRVYRAAVGIAAAAALVAGLSWIRDRWMAQSEQMAIITNSEKPDWILYDNTTPAEKVINLPDGSQVTLAVGSQLAVHRDFHQTNREVRLLGEAGFNVQRDPLNPFLVYSGEIITKVLGTSFHIRADSPAKPIMVTVTSGKVTVFRKPKENEEAGPNSGVILTPNQKATYFPDNQQFVTAIIEGPQPIDPAMLHMPPNALVFHDTPIRTVIRELEVMYGTEIELEQEALGECPFTGNLRNQEMHTQLELVCGTINGAWEIRGTRVLISGKGCL